MTEPDISSSDPTQLQTTAILEGDEWVINGTKWFTTGAARASYTTVMCRTELDVPSHGAFSMIIVPTDNPGYKIVRETPVLGINGGHYEVKIIGKYNLIPNVFAEFKNNALILSTSNYVKLHGIVINRMQVIFTL